MRLTILGCGTCVPSATRVSSGYFVEAGGARVRLDCGPGTVHAMARHGVDWDTVTHQFVSHFHMDHVADLGPYLFALKYGRKGRPPRGPLTLLGPAGLATLLDGIVATFGSHVAEQEFPLAVIELAPGEEIELPSGGRLVVAKTPHTVNSLAVRVEQGGRAVGYTGDTAPDPALAAFFRGVDLLVAECSFVDDNRATPHLLIDETAALAREAGARRLLAVHSYFDPEAEGLAARLARGFSGEIFVGIDGMTLDV